MIWQPGDVVRFAHQAASGPDHSVYAVDTIADMIWLEDMGGWFAPHLFACSPMKRKAREIIPHWPRGRSTSCRRRWLERELRDDEQYRCEWWAGYVYHRDQQEMVTHFLEKLHRGGILHVDPRGHR